MPLSYTRKGESIWNNFERIRYFISYTIWSAGISVAIRFFFWRLWKIVERLRQWTRLLSKWFCNSCYYSPCRGCTNRMKCISHWIYSDFLFKFVTLCWMSMPSLARNPCRLIAGAKHLNSVLTPIMKMLAWLVSCYFASTVLRFIIFSSSQILFFLYLNESVCHPLQLKWKFLHAMEICATWTSSIFLSKLSLRFHLSLFQVARIFMQWFLCLHNIVFFRKI